MAVHKFEIVMSPRMSTTFREAKVEDVEELYKLLVESTRGSTKLTADRLKDDLFSVNTKTSIEVLLDDSEIEFDISLLQSNTPVARAIVAEVDGAIVGYLIFHSHWGPWTGHIASIDDVFTRPSMRKKGIASRLVQEASDIAQAEGIKKFLFTVGRMSSDLRQHLKEEGKSFWYRNDKTDWSVLRINLNETELNRVINIQRGC